MITFFFTTFKFGGVNILIADILIQIFIIVHSISPPVILEWSHIYYMAGDAAGQARTGGETVNIFAEVTIDETGIIKQIDAVKEAADRSPESQIVHIPSQQDKTGHLHKSLTEAVDAIVI